MGEDPEWYVTLGSAYAFGLSTRAISSNGNRAGWSPVVSQPVAISLLAALAKAWRSLAI